MNSVQAPARAVVSLRIELCEVDPCIWRRIWVPLDIHLQRLHQVIQAAMGWSGYHLHEFHIGRHCYALAGEHELAEGCLDERGVSLEPFLLDGLDEFFYHYDLRDIWRHRIVLEAQQAARPNWRYPLCSGGARACPPEGAGGSRAYDAFVASLEEGDDNVHQRRLDALGGFFDPAGFDANAANVRMAKLRL